MTSYLLCLLTKRQASKKIRCLNNGTLLYYQIWKEVKVKTSKKLKFMLNPILVAMLGLPIVAQAENNTDTTIVTANRTSQSISDIAATVLVIEGEQIAEQAKSGVEFKAMLAQLIPSLDVGSESRTNARQYMRGRTTLVMIDGVSLNSSRSLSRQFDSINPFNIARIEVVSGASAIYGGGSSGGIINIITKKGADAGELSGETWFGVSSGGNSSEDVQYQVAQSVSMKNEKMDARFAISYDQTGASYDSNGDMVLQDPTQTTSQYVSQIDIMATAGFNLSDTKRVDLMAQYYNSTQDSDYGIDYGSNYAYYYSEDDIEMVDGYSLDDQAATERFMATVEFSDSDLNNQTLNLQLYARSEKMSFNPFSSWYLGYSYAQIVGGFGVYDYISNVGASQQDTTEIGAKLVLTAQPVEKLELVYGLDLNYEEFTSSQTYYDVSTAASSGGLDLNVIGEEGRYPDIGSSEISAFLQANYEVTPTLALNSGLRYEYTKTRISDFVGATQQYLELAGEYADGFFDEIEGGTNDYSHLSANTSLIFDLNKEQQVWLNLSQGYEIPDISKYYGSAEYNYTTGEIESSTNVSDNPLEAITTNAIELGWRVTQENLSAQLTGYYSLSNKQIELQDDFTIDVVDNDQRIYGLEGQISYFVTQAFSVGTNFNYIVTETKTDGKWEDVSIQTASPSKLTAYVNWQVSQISTRLQTTQMFDYKDADNEKLEGYNTVDLLSSINLPLGQLQLGITNLLDTEYDTLWSQRAVSLYGGSIPGIGDVNDGLFEFEGQGRTYSLNYNVEF